MKSLYVICMSLFLSFIFISCKQQKETETIIGQVIPEVTDSLMKPETLWYFGRISEFTISEDGSKLAFLVQFFNIELNKGNREIFLIDLKTGQKTQITHTPQSEVNIQWKPGTNDILVFLYPDEEGNLQIFEQDINSGKRKQISHIKGGIEGFLIAPDGKNIAYFASVPRKPTPSDLYPDLPKANVRIIDEHMYRHWDRWIESFTHIFIAPYSEQITEGFDIMKDEPWESPVRPFGGKEQIAWHPDSRSLVYTCRKLRGLQYTLSTNTDLYLFSLDDSSTINLTDGMKGYDMNPVFSPNGQFLAWESMEREGYEADKHRLMVLNLTTSEKKDLTEQFDANAYNLRWSDDNETIYFTTDWYGSKEIFKVSLHNPRPEQVTNGIHDYVAIELTGNHIIALKQSMSKPSELYKLNVISGEEQEISYINKELLSKLKMGKVEKRWISTTDGKQMLTWIIYPPFFDSTKTYPALLYCQGGPQGMVSQFWSYRWNFQLMAANGYVVVAPNRRGVPGFGMEWLEQISGDYGGQNIRDYLSAIDEVARDPWIDAQRLGAVGASYGGYSVFHLAGIHQNRFKAFVAHSGIFNFESKYLETDELWFPNWDYGGPFWKKNDPKIQRSYAASPHLYVQNWNTPILIMHGEKDYRISYTQSLQAFSAAQILGVPSRLVLFPDENHWILKPQNAIVWQREFFGWLDKYLKNI